MEPLSLPLVLACDAPLFGSTALCFADHQSSDDLGLPFRLASPRLRVCTNSSYMQRAAAMASGVRIFSTNRMRGDFLVSRAEAHVHLVQLVHS